MVLFLDTSPPIIVQIQSDGSNNKLCFCLKSRECVTVFQGTLLLYQTSSNSLNTERWIQVFLVWKHKNECPYHVTYAPLKFEVNTSTGGDEFSRKYII